MNHRTIAISLVTCLFTAACSENLTGVGTLNDGRPVEVTAQMNQSGLAFDAYQLTWNKSSCLAKLKKNTLSLTCDDGRTGSGNVKRVIGVGGSATNVITFALNDGTTGTATHAVGWEVG